MRLIKVWLFMLPLVVILVHSPKLHYLQIAGKSAPELHIQLLSKGNILPGKVVSLEAFLSGQGKKGPVRYQWALENQPVGSTLHLQQATDRTLSFVVTHTGSYTVNLTTWNGTKKQAQKLTIQVTRSPKPGMGSSVAPPSGRPYAFPAGIRLAGTITGFTAFCNDAEEAQLGSGQEVQVCFPLQNHTDQDITFTLPAGFILVSSDLHTQNGILLQSVPIHVSAHSIRYTQLYLYCLNRNRLPSGESSVFTVGPVTKDPEIKDFISLLRNKKLSPPTHLNRELTESVQNTLWQITDGDGLTTRLRHDLMEI